MARITAADTHPLTPPVPIPENGQPPEGWNPSLRWPPVYRLTGRSLYRHSQRIQAVEENFDRFGTWDEMAAILHTPARQHRYDLTPADACWLENLIRRANPNLLPPWHNEAWWRFLDMRFKNFVLMSQEVPGMITYFASEDKLMRNQRTRVRPGRFLMKFCKSLLTEKQIASYASWAETGERESAFSSKNTTVTLATSREDIVDAYMNGPKSCMTAPARHYSSDGIHPVEAYAAGDLAVAVLRDKHGRVIGRAMVRPSTMTSSRVYPTPNGWRDDGFTDLHESEDARNALKRHLRDLGYAPLSERPDGFNGARLLWLEQKRKSNGHYRYIVAPFVDGEFVLKVTWEWRDDDWHPAVCVAHYNEADTHRRLPASAREAVVFAHSHATNGSVEVIMPPKPKAPREEPSRIEDSRQTTIENALIELTTPVFVPPPPPASRARAVPAEATRDFGIGPDVLRQALVASGAMVEARAQDEIRRMEEATIAEYRHQTVVAGGTAMRNYVIGPRVLLEGGTITGQLTYPAPEHRAVVAIDPATEAEEADLEI